jgi:hypothetical protein
MRGARRQTRAHLKCPPCGLPAKTTRGRFRRNFRDVPWVRVPMVHWEYCSPRVLTLEYLPGVTALACDV